MSNRDFIVPRRLAFGEADPAGTIYAPRALDFAIQAIELLWIEATGISFRELNRRKMGAPYVNIACQFAQPLRAGEEFALRVRIEKLGNSSLTYDVKAHAPDGVLLMHMSLTSVVISTETMKAIPIPDQIRAALQAFRSQS